MLMLSTRELFKGLYKQCDCKCGTLIPIINKYGKIIRFMPNHHLNGSNNHKWKGGRGEDGGYWSLLLPDYYRANRTGRVKEHIYIYETYHKLCMLPWGDIHHKDGNTKNNDISNLQGMMRLQHHHLHHKKDMSKRFCSYPGCLTPYKTNVRKNGSPRWYKNPNKEQGEWVCSICNMKIYNAKKKKKKLKNLS